MTARQYLKSRSWLGKKFGLRTMRRIVTALGHPENAFQSVLIAGTNGKGSVSAYLDAGLRAAGLRVGRYTSPHLIDIRERITVDGADIGARDFERLVLMVKTTATRLKRRGEIVEHPNHFEILTATAFLFFQERKVDIAVLEVGLGGRLDATNVASPLVSAIVSIDFDHEELLGNTLASIAREKAGVVRRKRVTVVGPMAEEARATITAVAENAGATVLPVFDQVSTSEARGGSLEIRTPAGFYPGLRPLPGAHQRVNLVVAIRALEALRDAGLSFEVARAVRATSGAQWPGRLERFDGAPPYLLDGAHNPAGAHALALYLDERRIPYTLVFGAMRDKHVREMARELFPRARRVIATRVRMKRAATTAHLAAIGAELAVPVEQEGNLDLAMARASREASPRETVVVAGSLYLVGAFRKRLLKRLQTPSD